MTSTEATVTLLLFIGLVTVATMAYHWILFQALVERVESLRGNRAKMGNHEARNHTYSYYHHD